MLICYLHQLSLQFICPLFFIRIASGYHRNNFFTKTKNSFDTVPNVKPYELFLKISKS